MGNERRKDYMVNQRVHLLYMVTWITSLLVVASAVGTGYSLYRMAQRQPVEIVGVNAYALIGGLVFVLVASALTLGVYAIVHTHRMLSSAYAIGMYLNKINTGQASYALNLRDGDYFKEIADEINRMRPPSPGTAPAAPAPAPPAPTA